MGSFESLGVPQEEPLPEEAPEKAKSMLNQLSRKAHKAASLVMFATAASGMTSEASARDTSETKGTDKAQTEQIQKSESKTKEQKLRPTSASSWSIDLAKEAESDISKIKTAEDAAAYSKKFANGFTSELLFPTKGKIKRGEIGLNAREYTDDDCLILAQNAQKIKVALETVDKKFKIPNLADRIGEIDKTIAKLQENNSYASKQWKKAAEEYLKSNR